MQLGFESCLQLSQFDNSALACASLLCRSALAYTVRSGKLFTEGGTFLADYVPLLAAP